MAEETIHCVVEIPRGSRNKYEFDHALAITTHPGNVGSETRTSTSSGSPSGASVSGTNVYKDLDVERYSRVGDWADRTAAWRAIEAARTAWAQR